MKTAVFKALAPAAALALLCAGCNEPIQAVVQDDYTEGQIILVDEAAAFGPTAAVPGWCYGGNPEAEVSPVPWTTSSGGHKGEGIDLDATKVKPQLRFYGATSGHQIILSPLWGSGAITVNTWIYWRGAGLETPGTNYADDHGQVIFGICGTLGNFRVSINDDKAYSNAGYTGKGNASGLLAQVAINANNVFIPAASTTPLPKNSWHMVTATLSGTDLALYLDGNQIAAASCSTKMTDLNLGMFRMGSAAWGPPSLNAVIDDASWWPGVALSAEAIKKLYDDTK
jgi:hypothetical protein